MRDARTAFAGSVEAQAAQLSLQTRLARALRMLEPQVLGLYWPVQGEFNAVTLWLDDEVLRQVPASLPFARRAPPEMHYRAWNGAAPDAIDECGIASASGKAVEPDVVLVPCVGFTRSGFRLGYGGGFFDRWLAAHPGVTAVGVAWAHALIADGDLAVQPHDHPLTFVVTEEGVVG